MCQQMPDVPVVEPPACLGDDLPLLPRKPRNVARKHVVKKLKASEDTRQEESTSTCVVEHT
jgi:hypothetical protein